MTLNEMRAYIRRKFGWPAADTDQTNAIDDALNDAYMEVAGLLGDSPWLDHEATESVTSSSTTVDLSAFQSIRGAALYGTAYTYNLICNVPARLWMLQNGHVSLMARATPTHLLISSKASGDAGQRVLKGTLAPYPDGAYTFWCTGSALVTPLTNGTDVPFFPAMFHRVVPCLAYPRLMHEEGFDQQMAVQQQKQADRLLEGLMYREAVVTDPTQSIPRIGP